MKMIFPSVAEQLHTNMGGYQEKMERQNWMAPPHSICCFFSSGCFQQSGSRHASSGPHHFCYAAGQDQPERHNQVTNIRAINKNNGNIYSYLSDACLLL